MGILVNVTQKNIDDATSRVGNVRAIDNDPTGSCMVALALKDIFPGSEMVVGFGIAEINRITHYIPRDVSQKILDLCNGEKVEPFSFELTR